MDKCINFYEFLRYVFDDEKAIRQGAEIVKALLEAQSPRLSNISEKMPGKGESNYKAIQRFLKKVDMKRLLLRFYQEDAEFMIGDPTEMERYKAPHTAYVGTLSDGKTAGYWLMVLSTPFRGRSLPCSFVVYSSRTLGEQVTSRNQEHFRSFGQVKELLGDRPLVLDREFCYEALMEILYIEYIQFVIRLNLGDQHKPPRLSDADGEPVKLFIQPGETIIRPNVLPGHRQGQSDRLLAQKPLQTLVGYHHLRTQTRFGDLSETHENRRDFPRLQRPVTPDQTHEQETTPSRTDDCPVLTGLRDRGLVR